MATESTTLCLPGTSGQVFARCLQIPTDLNENKTFFKDGGIGPRQEGGESIQTHKNRGRAIRAKAWLGALGKGVVRHVWVMSMGVGMVDTVEGNNQTEGDPKKKSFDLFQIGVGFGFGFGFGFVSDGIPISRPSAGPFISTGRDERVRPVKKCGWTS